MDTYIWDHVYLEEYIGLHDCTTMWGYNSESEYQMIRPTISNALPTMDKFTVRRDEYGNPTRAKYRIVILWNLDQNDWYKSE